MIVTLRPDELVRFHSKIARGHDCWIWQGETNNRGYGRFPVYRESRRIRLLAHRTAFELATGVDPGSQVVRHTCDTPPCCNPLHHLLGTQADNIQDTISRGRANFAGMAAYRRARDDAARQRLITGKKQCSSCRIEKPLSAFNRSAAEVDGRAYWCKDCVLAHQRRYRASKRQDGAA